jgi:hypothetical protein
VSALHRLSGVKRSNAVRDAFGDAINSSPDGRAQVAFRGPDGAPATVTVFLIGLAWNPTHNGTQEALIVRQPEARYAVDMIPFTRLISIQAAS